MRNGGYPWPLKKRILSQHGHLSNESCADLLAAVQHDALQTVILMHLSEQNNCPDLARSTSARVLGNLPAHLEISRQDQATPLIPVK
jgi:phosphoribosyl 1,2-cyclic phosphodiesterase